ncbi:MAG: hypothetical protein Q9205_006201 [Flavoplaca limonia]
MTRDKQLLLGILKNWKHRVPKKKREYYDDEENSNIYYNARDEKVFLYDDKGETEGAQEVSPNMKKIKLKNPQTGNAMGNKKIIEGVNITVPESPSSQPV